MNEDGKDNGNGNENEVKPLRSKSTPSFQRRTSQYVHTERNIMKISKKENNRYQYLEDVFDYYEELLSLLNTQAEPSQTHHSDSETTQTTTTTTTTQITTTTTTTSNESESKGISSEHIAPFITFYNKLYSSLISKLKRSNESEVRRITMQAKLKLYECYAVQLTKLLKSKQIEVQKETNMEIEGKSGKEQKNIEISHIEGDQNDDKVNLSVEKLLIAPNKRIIRFRKVKESDMKDSNLFDPSKRKSISTSLDISTSESSPLFSESSFSRNQSYSSMVSYLDDHEEENLLHEEETKNMGSHRNLDQETADIHEIDDINNDDNELDVEFETDENAMKSLKPNANIKDPWYIKLYHVLSRFLPFLKWVPEYRHHWKDIKNDLFVGITVGVMMIPQSMAYSMVAGFPPVYGLYTALVSLLVYPFVGTSPHVSVGPTAIVALLTYTSIERLKPAYDHKFTDFVALGTLLSVMVGVVQILFGIFKLGFLMNFLANPVISGFTSAASVTILAGQIKYFFGISIPNSKQLHLLLIDIFKNLPSTSWTSIVLSVVCISIILVINYGFIKIRGRKFEFKKIPNALVLVFFSTLLMYLLKLFGNVSLPDGSSSKGVRIFGIEVIGEIQSGIPIPTLPTIYKFELSFDFFKILLSSVIPIVIIGYIESISIAKFFASKFRYEVDNNQEFIALGTCCLVGGLFQGFPATGSLSRTAVVATSGAKSQFASIFAAMIVLMTLLFLTPVFYYLPKVALASIIAFACIKLFNYEEIIFTFKTRKRDCLVLLITLFITLFVGIEEGIIISTICSLVLVIIRASFPRFMELGRMPGTAEYRSAQRWDKVIKVPGIITARLESDLFFSNCSYFKDQITKFVKQSQYPVYYLVLDCSSINYMDSTGIHTLELVKEYTDSKGIVLYFAQVKESIMLILKKAKFFPQKCARDCFFLQLHDAVNDAKESMKIKMLQETEQNQAEGYQQNNSSLENEQSAIINLNDDDDQDPNGGDIVDSKSERTPLRLI